MLHSDREKAIWLLGYAHKRRGDWELKKHAEVARLIVEGTLLFNPLPIWDMAIYVDRTLKEAAKKETKP